jgi:preprotein translocase subunit SecB
MASDQPNEYVSTENKDTNTSASQSMLPISLQPFAIQPLDILPIEIVARRFPIAISNVPLSMNGQFNIVELNVDPETLQAHVTLEVKIESSEEPPIFEILFKLVGIFTYKDEYTPEMVGQFLQQGSLSIFLPFARELVLSLSTRLHLPPIVLSLIQLAPPSTEQTE